MQKCKACSTAAICCGNIHLAAYILNNYEGVLITRNDQDGNLSGYVFKRNGEIRRSEAIVIASDSYAPVFLSRREATVISDDIHNYLSASSFDKKYSFDERVRSFLDVPIRNFINYHAGDVSIIASIRSVPSTFRKTYSLKSC